METLELTKPELPPREKSWVWCLALVVLSLAAYVPSLGGPFLWDDHVLIEQSPHVQKIGPLASYFSSYWQRDNLAPGESTYFRPLASLSFALDHALHGNNPSGFHLTNIILHAATAGVLFALLRKRGLSPVGAAAGGLAWGWFPRLSEAVAWISGRTDVLAAFFSLLGLLLYERGRWMRWLAAVCLFLGLLAKEVAVAALLGAAVWAWSDGVLRSRLMRVAPLTVAMIAYAALRANSVGVVFASTRDEMTLGKRLGCALEALGRYLSMLVDAWRPGIQLGVFEAPRDGFYVMLGIIAALLILSLLLRFRSKIDGFERGLVVMGLVSLGVVLHILPIPATSVAADRYMYLPMLALALLVAPRVGSWLSERRAGWSVGLGIYLGSLGLVTWFRAELWSDEVEFWARAFREQKDNNALSRMEMGNLYARAGLLKGAGALYLDADPFDYPRYLGARKNAAGLFLSLDQPDVAIDLLKDVVARAPAVPQYRLALAIAYGAQGQLTNAKKNVAEVLRISPEYGAALNYSRILEQPSSPPSSYPESVEGQLMRAAAASKMNRAGEAVRAMLRASELGPLPKSEWEPVLLYMFDSASFRQLETMFERYRQQQTPNPVLVQHFAERAERVARLRELWPSLVPLLRQGERLAKKLPEVTGSPALGNPPGGSQRLVAPSSQ